MPHALQPYMMPQAQLSPLHPPLELQHPLSEPGAPAAREAGEKLSKNKECHLLLLCSSAPLRFIDRPYDGRHTAENECRENYNAQSVLQRCASKAEEPTKLTKSHGAWLVLSGVISAH